MVFYGAHERLDFARFGHQEEQRECVVSLLAAFAHKVAYGLVGETGSCKRRAYLSATVRRSFTQGACESGCPVRVELIERARRSVSDFNRRVIKGRCDL